MKTFYELIKESNAAIRQAGAHFESLLKNAEQLESVLSGDVPDALQSAIIVTSAKIALKRQREEVKHLFEATHQVRKSDQIKRRYQVDCKMRLLELMQRYELGIYDAWAVLDILYQEFNKRNPS